MFISNEPRGMEHCLFLMKPRGGTMFISNEPRGGTMFISTEPRGMEHCLFLMNLESWNIVYI